MTVGTTCFLSKRKRTLSIVPPDIVRLPAPDMPPLPEAVAAFKDALTEARAAEDHLRTVLTEGGWLND